MVIPTALKCLWKLGYGGIQRHGICVMQQDITVHFMVRTVLKGLNKKKGWYKKVTLTTIPVCRSTEAVLHCNPKLGFQVSKSVWGCKYGFDQWFLWLRRKLLWLWQGITFNYQHAVHRVFFCNLSLESEKQHYTTEAAPYISNFITWQPGRPEHSFLAVLS